MALCRVLVFFMVCDFDERVQPFKWLLRQRRNKQSKITHNEERNIYPAISLRLDLLHEHLCARK